MNEAMPNSNPPRPENPPPVDHPESPPEKSNRKFYQRPWVIVLGAMLLGLVCFFGVRYLIHSRTHETTDDAFLQADTVNLAPRVSGQVRGLYVTDNEQVSREKLLVEIDPRDYEAVVAEKRAAWQATNTGLESARANFKLSESRVATAQATAAQREAEAAALRAVAERAARDLARNQNLLESKTISPQEFDAARSAAASNQANLKAAEEQVTAARSSVTEARNAAANAQAAIATAEAQIKQAAADLQAAELNLSYTKVLAPIDGRVTHRAVDVGDYLQVGQNIMALVPNEVYVVANFKETQLRHMRPGQPVTIKIDAYSQNTYTGRVNSIQAGSGASFSLLPPENAVGNFVKVVQRVPVKIVFNAPPGSNQVFGPGLSVSPSVRVKEFNVSNWLLFIAAIFVTVVTAWLGLRWASRAHAHAETQPTQPGS